MSRIRVLLVEDEFFIRDSWKNLIMRDPRTLLWDEASDVDEAIAILEEGAITGNRPDVVLLDMHYRKPQENASSFKGLGTIQQIKKVSMAIRVLCISTVIDPMAVVQAVNHGANGFLDKNHVKDGLVDNIEMVYQGRFPTSPHVAAIIMESHTDVGSMFRPAVLSGERAIALTKRREEIVTYYFRYGMSAQEIAEKLEISKKTVESHVKTIRKILGATSNEDLIRIFSRRKDVLM